MRLQGDRDNRGAPHARPRPHAAGDSDQVQRVGGHGGVPEGVFPYHVGFCPKRLFY